MADGAVSVFHLEAEQALLGAALFDNRTLARVSLTGAHFYDPVHGDLWEELAKRYREERLGDAIAMKEWAAKRCPEIGGAGYLLKLEQAAAPLSAQVLGYADLLRDLARRRALIAATHEAAEEAKAGEIDGATVQARLEQRLVEIAHADADDDSWERLGVGACASIERAELGETKGISTGIRALDAVTGGLKPGLWVIGGATSMGKSIIGRALTYAVGAAGYGVAEHHLEMTADQVGLRAAASLAFDPDPRASNPTYLDAMRGALPAAAWNKLRGAAKATAHLPIYIDTRPGRTVSQIEASSRRLMRKFEREGVKPGCVLIDHEGLIAAEKGARFPSQLERTNARAEALAAMAKRLGVCVIALSQITKEGARADGDERLPTLLDLNYGGAISQAADVVVLIHRRAYYEERKPSHLRDASRLHSRETTLVVDKTRDGRRGHVSVFMDTPTAAVWEAA